MKRLLISIIAFTIVCISCNNTSKEVETNRILRKLVNQSRDSIAVYFQRVDSLGKEKIKTVTHPQEPDSVAIYYKSVDSLRLPLPITRKYLHLAELVEHPKVDSLISDSTIGQWNEQTKHYASHKWSKKERKNLPVLNKKPKYLDGHFDSKGALKKMLYFSTPFYNINHTKAFIYRYQFSSDGKNGQVYILVKEGKRWHVIYRGNTFNSSF